MIDKIFQFAESNAKTVIATLFGIIVVGSVGGGLWIHNLQSSLEEEGKLYQSTRELQKQQYETSNSTNFFKVTEAEAKVRDLAEEIERSERKLKADAGNLAQLSESHKIPTKAAAELQRINQDLEDTADELDQALQVAKTTVVWAGARPEPASGPTWLDTTKFVWSLLKPFILFILVLTIAVLVVWSIRKRLRKESA